MLYSLAPRLEADHPHRHLWIHQGRLRIDHGLQLELFDFTPEAGDHEVQRRGGVFEARPKEKEDPGRQYVGRGRRKETEEESGCNKGTPRIPILAGKAVTT